MRSDRLVFMRRGGLGDFILSLPLLRALRARYRHVCLVTRRVYLELLPDDCICDGFFDADGAALAGLFADPVPVLSRPMHDAFRDADVVCFLAHDPRLADTFAQCGVRGVRWVNSRPAAPPHAVLHFLAEAGIEPAEAVLTRPLCSGPRCGSGLWVHPGSGSPAKNVPLSRLAEFAQDWLKTHAGPVLVSFGEADTALVEPVRLAFAAAEIPYQTVLQPALAELKCRLCTEAGAYVGNDSGVSHLAGALGLPVTVFFRGTDPRIWRPLGNVEVVQWQS